MKKIIKVTEGEGLAALLGQTIMVWCVNYIYTGTLTGVNEDCVLLTDPAVVYETGPFTTPGYKDAQPLHCKSLYVRTGAIEAFCAGK
jgi:hypothetical protein